MLHSAPNNLPKKRRYWLIIPILLIIGFFGLVFFKTGFTISQIFSQSRSPQMLPHPKELPQLPEKDPGRINILLLGIRGAEDPGEGKFLSDSIIILSIKKDGQTDNGRKVALISLPRDLYVEIWGLWEKRKINFAFPHGGFETAKKTVSLVTGLYIDYAVSADFEGLKEAIDALGGITIYLDQPFEETFQWAKEGQEQNKYWMIKKVNGQEVWAFYLPAGWNELDGQAALYYSRSRLSTSDFDRMRRQQQIILAAKEKALSLGVLANPIKIYNLLDVLGEHIKTDMGLSQIKEFIGLAPYLDAKNIKKLIFDTTPSGLLYETTINNEYVLLPVGDNFEKIQKACKNIFD